LDVTWLGHGCFRLRGRNAILVTDPYPPSLGPKLPRLDADIVTISHEHPNHSNRRAVKDDAFIIDGPGEYEVQGVTVLGLPSFHDASGGAEHGPNTIYVIEIDDVTVCHLGDLGHSLVDADLEAIGTLDILMVPVGGKNCLNAVQAAEVVRQLEPRLIVPMHYALPAIKTELEPLERFLKEMGVASAEPQARLSIGPGSGDVETKVQVLEARI
jgi:L-ascorbate metabolism protein UlaG (beta-lactamase superfamily)